MHIQRLNRTSVGLKRKTTAKASMPYDRLNRTSVGLKLQLLAKMLLDNLQGLNRTSVGLKQRMAAENTRASTSPQSNQRGIETCVFDED